MVEWNLMKMERGSVNSDRVKTESDARTIVNVDGDRSKSKAH